MNGINNANPYLDLAGLQKFWAKAKEYIISQKSIIVAAHATKEKEGETVNIEWVSVTNDGKNPTTYTISDINLNDKLNNIDQEITEIKTTAGVTSVAIDDNSGNLVKVAVTNPVDGKAKGDVTITVDDAKLENFATTTTTNIGSVDTARKNDIAKLAGDNWKTADDLAADGSWETEPTYPSIQKLSEAIDDINSGLVSEVTVEDKNNGSVNYVSFTSNNPDGKGAIKLTVDETGLDTKIAEIDKSISDEVTARKADVATLAGAGWDATTNAWSVNKPAYADITALSNSLKTAESRIAALISATEFVGVVAWDPNVVTVGDAETNNGVTSYPITGEKVPADTKLQNGDIVIYEQKEYILYAAAKKFVELGDTTAEQAHITAIETWINTPITEDEINALFTSEE